MIPEEFGAFTVLAVLGGGVNAVVSGGGDMWLNRFVTQEKVSRNRPPHVWPFYLTICCVVSIGTMLMAWGVTALVPALHEKSGAILLTVFTFGLAGVGEALLATLRATGRTILFFSVRDILVPITALMFLIILRPESVSGFVIFSLYAWLVAQWKFQRGWLRRSLATPLIKHTLLLMMTNIASRASNYIDILVLLFFVGLADLGEYRIAAQFAIGFIVIQHFVFLSLPYQLRHVGSSAERQYSQRRLQDSQRNLITLSLIGLVFVLVLSEWLLSILGERFIDSAYVVRAMFLIRFFELLWGPQHEVLVSNGAVRFEVAASLTGVAAWIISFAFIYKLVDPVTAAIIATAIGVHLGHIVRAITLTFRGIYCPRLVLLRQQT
jgi:O-antigen/teichoic acid export membrane protein